MSMRGAQLPRSCDATGRLTPRTCEILRALATGQTAREAAEDLFISERTVHDHLRRAYRALGVGSLQGALLRAGIVVLAPSDGPA